MLGSNDLPSSLPGRPARIVAAVRIIGRDRAAPGGLTLADVSFLDDDGQVSPACQEPQGRLAARYGPRPHTPFGTRGAAASGDAGARWRPFKATTTVLTTVITVNNDEEGGGGDEDEDGAALCFIPAAGATATANGDGNCNSFVMYSTATSVSGASCCDSYSSVPDTSSPLARGRAQPRPAAMAASALASAVMHNAALPTVGEAPHLHDHPPMEVSPMTYSLNAGDSIDEGIM